MSFEQWVAGAGHFDTAPVLHSQAPPPAHQQASATFLCEAAGRGPLRGVGTERAVSLQQEGQQQRAATGPARGPAKLGTQLAAQKSFNVLIKHYLDMVPEAPRDFEKPKGFARLIVGLSMLACIFDFRGICKATLGMVTFLARLLAALSFAVVPAWLWGLRHLYLQHQGPSPHLYGLAFGGAALLLLTDMLTAAYERSWDASRRGVLTAKQLGSVAPPRYLLASAAAPAAAATPVAAAATPAAASRAPAQPAVAAALPTRPQHAASAAATRTASGAAAGSSTGLASAGSAGSRGATAAGGSAGSGQRAAEEALIKSVRQAIIKLDTALYGNDLTEGLLPVDALPSHVRKLCEEVGVAWDPTRPATLEWMQRALQEVARQVGV